LIFFDAAKKTFTLIHININKNSEKVNETLLIALQCLKNKKKGKSLDFWAKSPKRTRLISKLVEIDMIN